MSQERTLAHASLVPSLDDSQIPDSGVSIHEQIRQYYGDLLAGSDDLKTNACCCTEDRPPKYVLDVMPLIDDEIIERFYGCGSPIPPALEGCTVLDLGCGVGRDVYILSKLVGPAGKVVGIDMTANQLEVAKRHKEGQARVFGHERSNVDFRQGFIEDLKEAGIEDESIDLVVSNCVINLTPFKEQVFKEIYRVLKPGGELYFSDVFCDRRMPEELKTDPVLRGECLGGAIYIDDFKKMMRDAGWPDFLYTSNDDIHVSDLALETKLGFTGFTSRTVRVIKASNLEEGAEDYGQTAEYLGTIPEMPRYFDLDSDIRLIKGRKGAISSNMAEMLAQSRYGQHFKISAKKGHRGRFDQRKAQDAIDVKAGKKAIDIKYLDDTLARIGSASFYDRVGSPQVLSAPDKLETMQVNITYACNLACRHCYLECSPTNDEFMDKDVMQECLDAFSAGGFSVMDITGGSPELHPDFEWFLSKASSLASASGGHVIVRSNLTLEDSPEYERFLKVFADNGAHLVASLPYYDSEGADAQRGKGVFERVIRSVNRLNGLGYGDAGKDPDKIPIDLVYNVSGPFLPPPQDLLEDLYKAELARKEGIDFNQLFAFNNYPLGRFGQDLLDANMFDEYMSLLVDNFNALAVQRMMCRGQVNVDVDGRLYDCEVNHVLKLPIQIDEGQTCRDARVEDLIDGSLKERAIRTHPVCYSCSAGSGSSCSGSLVKEYA